MNNYAYPNQSMSEIINNGFFIVDRKWTVTHWNKAAENLLAVKAEQILGHNLWEALIGIIPLKFYTVYHKALLEDIPTHFEEYWEELEAWFDVITYYFDGTLSVSFKSSNRQTHTTGPEEQLKTLTELYRYVTEVTNDCLWEWDLAEQEIFWIDGGHKNAFGYPIVNAIVPQHFWEDRIHPGDKDRVLARLHAIIVAGSAATWEDEYRFKKADGEYAYVHDRAHIIYDGQNRASRMIGATQDTSARKAAEIKLLESERILGLERLNRQKEVTDAILRAQERERSEIGKEMHDNLNQILGAAKMYIELAKTDEENREMCLNKSTDYLMLVIEAIRKISKTLALPGKNIMGLSESIQILLDDMLVIRPIKIEFHENGISEEMLNEKLRLDIFRIVQEQLNNILKHAKATHAIINLTKKGNRIILLISDNGEGYDVSKDKNGMGNINIKSRAESHRGTAAILSKPGKGYELKVILPINDAP